MSPATRTCPFCGSAAAVVHVHGHGQCAQCGGNVEPCCAGSGHDDVETGLGHAELEADPRLFPRLFAQLGGEQATVARDALLFALAQWLGIGLDEAAIVAEAGVRAGRLQAADEGAFRLAQ